MARPKVAAVVTEYRHRAHAQCIIDRLLWGYPWEGRHHEAAIEVVSLYTDQVPESDLSRGRAQLFPSMRIYPTIAEALTLGGEELAVDGVVMIGEHGTYPRNEKRQTLWPRYEFFCEIVEVFRGSGRSVPVFSDKHLSWNWEWAQQMVATSSEMDFAFFAGSSVPWARRIPSVEMPWGAAVQEAVCVGPGGVDGYDIHVLEAAQCMLERRDGGETGVVAVSALEEGAVWKAMAAGSWEAGGWDRDLFEACLCRSDGIEHIRERDRNAYHDVSQMQALVDHPPVAYRYEYADGTRATMLLLEGLVHDFTFAACLKGQAEPLSTLMYLPGNGDFFIPLVKAIEESIVERKARSPIERTLLTTGLTAAGVESLFQGQTRLETPHLNVRYQAPSESLFWRG